jgi:hypothetical protein
MRKLRRSIARAKMQKEGIRRMNKKRHSTNPITGRPCILPSYFAENWRKYSR